MKNFEITLIDCIELLSYRTASICRIRKGEKANIKAQAVYLREVANKLDTLAELE